MADNQYTITGILKIKNSTVKVSEKFQKRTFVVTIEDGKDGKYQQHIECQLTQDRCALLDTHAVSDEIKVSYNLKGREWNSPQGEVKYFNTIEAWRIEGMKYDRIVEDASRITKDAQGKQALTEEIRAKDQDIDQLPF